MKSGRELLVEVECEPWRCECGSRFWTSIGWDVARRDFGVDVPAGRWACLCWDCYRVTLRDD